MKLAWVSLVLLARLCVATQWPLNLQLTPKASGGLQGSRSIYSVSLTVGRVGPLSLLVDSGSPALVVQGDFGASSTAFLGTDGGGGTATIHYGGATVTGDISRSRVCFDDSTAQTKGVCLKDFPVFEVTKNDAGFSQLGLDGILGLGPASGEAKLGLQGMDETLMDGLAKVGAPRIFGLYISPGQFFGASVLSLGGYDSTRIAPGAELQYMPLAQPSKGRWELTLQSIKLAPADGSESEAVDMCQGKTDCRVLLDSGTAQMASVPQLAEALGGKIRNEQGDCIDLKMMPDLHIELAGGSVFKLGPEDYVLDKGMCTLAVDEMNTQELARETSVAIILGEPFFQKVYAVFDQDNGQIGLAPSMASSGQQTQNEERRAQEKNDHAEHERANLMAYIR